jgi:adenosylhomocysteine nucleosidase
MSAVTSNELFFADPCVLFAMHRESAAFLREFRPRQRFPDAPCRARFCGEAWLSVLVLETGMGMAAAQKTMEWLASGPRVGNVAYRPKVVLCAGFAGGLQENLDVGDVVLASEVLDVEGQRWPATWPPELPPGEWRPPLHRGSVLCSPRLVADSKEKRELGHKFGSLAVEMESAVVAQFCKRADIPFGCVRAISDTVQTSLSPRVVSLLSGSGVSPVAVAAGMLRAPGLAGELWRLAKQTRLAADQLGKALGELLTLTLPWAAEL